MKFSVLIVDNDASTSNFIASLLQSNSYQTIQCKTGSQALHINQSRCPDIILLELDLPDIDGHEVISSIRNYSTTPIVVLSTRQEESEKIMALDSGADDYIDKPFGSGELLARLRTALRHSHQMAQALRPPSHYQYLDLFIDFDKCTVELQKKRITFTHMEYKLLSLLATHAGKVLAHEFIIKTLWGENAALNTQILRVNIANIRKKIEPNPAKPVYIFTESGMGYRMPEGA